MVPQNKIDISENRLRNRGRVLDILLSVRNTKQNIIWATDSYVSLGKGYGPKNQIKRELITGSHGKLIQPRASKSREEQKYRTKNKAEVFTPLKIVKKMNDQVIRNLNLPQNHTWKDFIGAKWLEITCGEAPFIVSRYDPTRYNGEIKPANKRVGFLDQKLQVVNKQVKSKKEWLEYAEIALISSYGYEWQGDNLLIARENVLLTLDDFYKDFCTSKLKLKSKQNLTDEQLEQFAEIISWNIFQMDGIKFVAPLSCKHINRVIPGENTIFGITPDIVEKDECEGCKFNRPTKHNGKYVKIMDWALGKPQRFVDLISNIKLELKK